jgi:hypothetical protein
MCLKLSSLVKSYRVKMLNVSQSHAVLILLEAIKCYSVKNQLDAILKNVGEHRELFGFLQVRIRNCLI